MTHAGETGCPFQVYSLTVVLVTPFYPCRTALAASDPGNRALHGCFSRHPDRFYPLVASTETGEALYPFDGGYGVSVVLQSC